MSAPVPVANADAQNLAALETPCLLLDIDRLERNCERMLARTRGLGVSLRPHLKTAKSAEVARRATDASRSITVSTLKEADHFARHGYSDIVCAAAVVPAKLGHAARIQAANDCDLILLTDSLAVARESARIAAANHITFSFLVEIDCGEHRSGLLPTDAAVIEIARAIHQSPSSGFAGC